MESLNQDERTRKICGLLSYFTASTMLIFFISTEVDMFLSIFYQNKSLFARADMKNTTFLQKVLAFIIINENYRKNYYLLFLYLLN
jgi:hypothetical protein